MRRLLLLLIVLTLLLAACSAPEGRFPDVPPYRAAAGTPLTITELTRVADNGAFSLWVEPEHSSFEVRSAGGTVWRSLPENFRDAEWVHEMLVSNLASILTVTALDASLARQELQSYEHCVRNGTVRYEAIPDGVRFIFRYERQGIVVPVDITLTDDGFLAQVAPGDIEETGVFTVSQIMLLPYFNSGTSDDDGFLFYPDGSGAISDYKKDYNNPADITNAVFGFDCGIGTIESVSVVEGYRMPVFGKKTNDASYLAVIEGDASFISAVHTGVMRRNNRYFKNAAIFTYRDVGRVFLRDSQTTVSTSYTVPSPVTAVTPMKVRYLLLEGGDVRYTDMAFAYREYLERTGVFAELLTDNAKNAHLTLMGAVEKPSSFLGIPMDREITLTTFRQAEEIIAALHEAGADSLSIFFKGAQAGGYNSQWTRSFRFNSSLGGAREWNRLLTSARDSGDDLYLIGELLQVYRTGRGFSASRDAARTTGNGLNFQYDYFVQDGTRNAYARRWYLTAPELWHDVFAGVRERDYMSAADAGRLVYSDYNQSNPVFRDRTGPALVAAMNTDSLALAYGNAYVWALAPVLYDVPLGASGFFLQSDEVPFYQLVTHGYIEYSGRAMNLSPDKQLSLLRSVEYGAIPHYFGIYAPSAELNRSILEGMFAACYLDWLDVAAVQANQTGDLYSLIRGQRMTGHEQLTEGVFVTTYENGTVVTVDYNTREFSVEVVA
jgi:hypothetical protein